MVFKNDGKLVSVSAIPITF